MVFIDFKWNTGRKGTDVCRLKLQIWRGKIDLSFEKKCTCPCCFNPRCVYQSGSCPEPVGNPLAALGSTSTGAGAVAAFLARLWTTETWHAESFSQLFLAGSRGRSSASSQLCSVPQGASQAKQETNEHTRVTVKTQRMMWSSINTTWVHQLIQHGWCSSPQIWKKRGLLLGQEGLCQAAIILVVKYCFLGASPSRIEFSFHSPSVHHCSFV